MHLPYLTEERIQQFITAALKEDVGEGDHSSLASVPAELKSKAQLRIKDNGRIAGIALAEKIFHAVDATLRVVLFKKDGEAIQKGEIGLEVEGSARSILTAERLVLNCMQRMSGIATYTHQLSEMIKHTSAKLMDTRKTTPNFRLMEKWAVAIGGGVNHRFALYDMIMLKDNHIDFAGGIRPAIERTHAYLSATGKKLRIEVETRTLEEVRQVVELGGIDVIMLDNMTPETMGEAVKIIGRKFKTEASGGITESTLKAVAECGVDYISIGALTHSVKSLDLSLKAVH